MSSKKKQLRFKPSSLTLGLSPYVLTPLAYQWRGETPRFRSNFRKAKAFSLNYAQRPLSHGSSFCNFRHPPPLSLRASSVDTAVVEAFESAEVLFKETFPLKRIEKVTTLSIQFHI